nr:hypothetical protein [Haloprofundus sp. MHR1]
MIEGPVRIGESLTAVCEIEEEFDGGRYRLTTRPATVVKTEVSE